jgi:raffinose/stachyose/melibiose transport system permease protein
MRTVMEAIARAGKYLLLALYAVVSLYPLVWLIFYSFKSNDEIFFTNTFGLPTRFLYQNYVRAWNAFNMLSYFKSSVIVTAATVVGTIFIAMLFAYATARMRWKLATPARLYVAIGLFIPTQVILIPLVMLMKTLHLSNSYFSLILPYVAFQLAFSSMAFYSFMTTIPYEFEEVASLDGAGVFTTFFRIIVPMVTPAMASVGIFVSLGAWNEFPVALILINKEARKTLPIGLINFTGQFQTDWGAVGASLVIASLPTIVMYLLFNRRIEKALTIGGALKG